MLGKYVHTSVCTVEHAEPSSILGRFFVCDPATVDELLTLNLMAWRFCYCRPNNGVSVSFEFRYCRRMSFTVFPDKPILT
jgi:hypothetical protein